MSDRSITLLIVLIVALGGVWATIGRKESQAPLPSNVPNVAPEMVPLVTGDESIQAMFTRAGCPVCHTIPGILGADGRVGPALILGRTGPARLQDPAYKGRANTIHDYIVESVVEPGLFVVPGYPANTMPTWYGTKLSALALERIASYLASQTGQEAP